MLSSSSGDANLDPNPDNKASETFHIDIYRTLVEHMLNGVAYCKMLYRDGQPSDFVYLYTNPAFEQLTGLKQVVGKPVSEVIPGIRETDPQLFDTYSRVAMGGEPVRFETFVESLAMWFWISVYSPKPDYFVAIFDVITERKQTELALSVASKRWSLAQRAAVAGSWYWDTKTNAHYWSDELYELFGREPQKTEAGFETWRELLHSEDRQQAEQQINQAISDHLPLASEYRIITPTGEVRWIRALGDTDYDEQGLALRMTGICVDITKTKIAEIALQESEERLRLAQSAADIGIWDWNIVHNKTVFNSQYYKLLGLPEGVSHGYEDFLVMVHPEDRSRLDAKVQQALAVGMQDYNIEYRLIRKNDGAMRWLASKGRFIVEDGRPLRSFGVIIDITERKQAEKALRESEARYRQMFKANPQPMWLYDLETLRFLAVNDAAVAHYGYSEAEFLAMTIADIRPVEDLPQLLDNIKQVKGAAQHQMVWCHRKKDGTLIDVEIRSHMLDFEGRRAKVVLANDITERRRAEERIHYLANFDSLTGLPNRTQLNDHLKYALSLAKRSNGHLALMFLDLDHFKDINDSLGHSIGDALLIELAKRLCLVLRTEDTVTRLGGDEFILLLPGVDASGAAHVAQKLLDAIAESYLIEHYDLTLTASIGIALYPEDGENLESLSKSADTAMYRAKQEGRQCYRFFTQEMQARSARNLQLVNALHHALEQGQLQVYYQPQISMREGRIIGAEALLHWQHPELGMVSPAEFIPVAEGSGLILPIGEWVLRCAVRQAKAWMDEGFGPLITAVNLSAVQFRHPDLPELVTRILDEEGLPPEYLELELTESVAMHNPKGAIAVMNNLHERGIRMSIDDFGTGYSSLSYLKKFKAYKLKIDQSFVRDISTDPEDKAIVSAIINLAKSLGLQTIAEGVETEGQLAFLREQGCDEMQGYLFSKPLPIEQFEGLLMQGYMV
ncbi:MAG TPA: EAL domain-containing protein [Methylobacter sp.]|jgi:diguanylate cyclase (GGDEF)-like protein/PAS domain S-box-containing protein